MFSKFILKCAVQSVLVFCLTSCAFVRIERNKNIVYQKRDSTAHVQEMQLNVFAPKKQTKKRDVLIYIHGGNWARGRKGLYSWLGSRLARKHVVAVVINYPLYPNAGYDDMAMATARSVKWVKENIAKYGGNPDKIFISGHSAGGHLAALVTLDDTYFNRLKMDNPIKGLVMIDAAGIDMYGYMKNGYYGPDDTYLDIFTKDPNVWKKASPLYLLHKGLPPMLIYNGERTYPELLKSNKKFVAALDTLQEDYTYKLLKRKKHIPMITQFFNVYNPRYKEIISFMKGK